MEKTHSYSTTQQFAGLSSPIPPPPAPKSWATLPLFAGLSEEAVEHFRDAMAPAEFLAGTAVLTQGEPGEDMFVLESGTMRIIVRNEKNVVVFERTISAPALFGEMALITREPRTASVVAEEDVRCLRIDKQTVQELFSRHPNTAVFLTRLVGERLMESKGIRKVGKYEVIGRLGSGGVATVFEARHPILGTPVALKMLSHALVFDTSFAEHFQHEARLVAQLSHDHIVRVLDTESAYGTHFIVMEKLTGDLLESLIDSGQPLDWPNCRRILREVCDALWYSHRQGLIHRDIKPANVFLLTDGKAKLLDFGIATNPGGGSAGPGGKVMGTPYYMSPEQILGQPLDGRADLYSLGIMAYEMCCRELPFDGDTLQQLFARHINMPTPDPRWVEPELPDDLCEFIRRTTAKLPEDRFTNCNEAANFLKAAAEVPVLDRFAMSSLSVTYHASRRELVERVLAEAVAKLEGQSGVALFAAHRGAVEDDTN
ncbi:MAG: protein kinase [Deltaproteobacteria bacterium]|nr:protein kinase [Deltaproteobacteria bacterium]